MLHPVDSERRPGLLTRAARAVGHAVLREDPRRFATLLERIIGDNLAYFTSTEPPETLSVETRSILGERLETLIDEAVSLAAELYHGQLRDRALLAIAQHVERVTRVIRVDPWTSRILRSSKPRSGRSSPRA